MLSIATDEAVQMLEAGWTVRYYAPLDTIEWKAPACLGGWVEHGCDSLDHPPEMAVAEARRLGHITERPRTPVRSHP